MSGEVPETRPASWRPFRSRIGNHVLVLRGSQILDVTDLETLDPETLAPYLDHGASLGLSAIPSVAPQSISLNVTSGCNLGCNYCYADRGRFGGTQTGTMSVAIAQHAVDTLLAGCDRQALATVGFMGGEPFLHRWLVHQMVAYTSAQARELGQPVGFSVTTNGTRLEASDLDLLRSHRFAVTISIDGGRATHDRLRRNLLGGGSWDDVVAGVAPLLARPGLASVSARATVCRDDLDLVSRYDALVEVSFTSIGFSPVRLGWGALHDDDWPRWTAASIALGERELSRIRAGGDTAFDNLRTALHQLHAGWSAPYRCGAGAGTPRCPPPGSGTPATGLSESRTTRWAMHNSPSTLPGSTGSWKYGTSSTWSRAGGAGRATCAVAVATRRPRLAPTPPATPSASGWSSASTRTASCRPSALTGFSLLKSRPRPEDADARRQAAAP